LRQNFEDAFLDHRDDKAMRQLGARHVEEVLRLSPELKALSSHHLCMPLPEMEECTILPVYLLRHPIVRIESVYDFERGQVASTPGASAAKKLSFASYTQWRMRADVAPTIRNYQTIYLAGLHNSPQASRGNSLADFGRAMKTLREAPLIGIVERYDESMVVMEDKLQAFFPGIDLSYVRQNVSKKRNSVSFNKRVARILNRLGDSQATVLDSNALDMAIYQLSNSRLDEAVAEIEDFPARLESFQKRCVQHHQAVNN